MRVETTDIGDFLANLEAAGAGNVFEKAVWRAIRYFPVETSKGVKVKVVLQAAAVITTEDGREYLLVLADECGVDYQYSSGDKKGTELARQIVESIGRFCKNFGLTVRPGTLSE
jgi:hypothetical protein